MTEVIGRSVWGARFGDGWGFRSIGAINSVWLHHSVTGAPGEGASWEQDRAAVLAVEAVGQQRFGRGMSYNYAIPPSGRIFEGCPLNRVGSHTQGYNTRGVGIVLVGNYESQSPTRAQVNAIIWLLQNVLKRNLSGGHRDTKGTACPGRHAYSAIPGIRAAFYGTPVLVENVVTPGPAPVPVAKTADGNELLAEDGVDGPRTYARLQQVMGTPIDGKVSAPSPMWKEVQRFLNSVLDDAHVANLTGKPTLDEDGYAGEKTIKALQFYLFNRYAPLRLGRGAKGSDFDGIDGAQTWKLFQYALNHAVAGSKRF